MAGEFDYYIPSRLDDPGKLLFWDVDVALVVVTGFMIGVYSANIAVFITSILGSMALASAYGKMKSGKHPGMSKHIIYWYLGLPRHKVTPPSWFREMIG
jgi:conjugal transfer pilus assembly protein TraL